MVGPQAEDRENVHLSEEVNEKGQPLWMAFLADPEALSISSDEVQDAKNAFTSFKNEHSEVISMCAHKKIEECKNLIESAQSAQAA